MYASSVLSEAIPLFPVYVLMFADAGLSSAQISSLLVIWQATAFVLQVPAGALADRPVGFVGLTAALSIITFLSVVVAIRLQHVVAGDARATVTSLAGVGGEGVAVTTTVLIGATAATLSIGPAVALLSVPLAVLGLMVPRLLH